MSKGQSVVMAIPSDGEPLAAVLAIDFPASLKGFLLVHEIHTAGHNFWSRKQGKMNSRTRYLTIYIGANIYGEG